MNGKIHSPLFSGRQAGRRRNRFLTGFTLVEVLIVVVIIAILAALIVPRMLAQTEKAKAAEALQTVGVISRAAQQYYDFHGNYGFPGIYLVADGPGKWGGFTGDGEWLMLGLTGLEKSKVWSYFYYDGSCPSCDPPITMFEVYAENGDYYITLRGLPDDLGGFQYDCDERILTNGGDSSKPCMPK